MYWNNAQEELAIEHNARLDYLAELAHEHYDPYTEDDYLLAAEGHVEYAFVGPIQPGAELVDIAF